MFFRCKVSATPEASSVHFVQLEQGNDLFEEGEDSVTESRDGGKLRRKHFFRSPPFSVHWLLLSGLSMGFFI